MFDDHPTPSQQLAAECALRQTAIDPDTHEMGRETVREQSYNLTFEASEEGGWCRRYFVVREMVIYICSDQNLRGNC